MGQYGDQAALQGCAGAFLFLSPLGAPRTVEPCSVRGSWVWGAAARSPPPTDPWPGHCSPIKPPLATWLGGQCSAAPPGAGLPGPHIFPLSPHDGEAELSILSPLQSREKVAHSGCVCKYCDSIFLLCLIFKRGWAKSRVFCLCFGGAGEGVILSFLWTRKSRSHAWDPLCGERGKCLTLRVFTWPWHLGRPTPSSIRPVSRWHSLAHLAQDVCSVFCFSFCKDIARKVNNKRKVLRELKCGCYGDVLCCE